MANPFESIQAPESKAFSAIGNMMKDWQAADNGATGQMNQPNIDSGQSTINQHFDPSPTNSFHINDGSTQLA